MLFCNFSVMIGHGRCFSRIFRKKEPSFLLGVDEVENRKNRDKDGRLSGCEPFQGPSRRTRQKSEAD